MESDGERDPGTCPFGPGFCFGKVTAAMITAADVFGSELQVAGRKSVSVFIPSGTARVASSTASSTMSTRSPICAPRECRPQDAGGRRVVIEVKVGEARDLAIGQIARYLGWFERSEGKAPRGILIAADFPEGVRYAATVIPNLQVIAYKVHFSFDPVSV